MNKPVLIIGIGQFGCSVADAIARNCQNDKANISVLAIDTDQRTIESISYANRISMAHSYKISEIINSLGAENLKDIFPCDRENDCVEYFESLDMNEGAGQWRMKAMLALTNYFSYESNKESFFTALDEIVNCHPDSREIDIYFIASLAGGTGSGLFLPLQYLIKNHYRKLGLQNINTGAILALPDIMEDTFTPEQKIKAGANTYAALWELDTVCNISAGNPPPCTIKIGDKDNPYIGSIYDSNDPIFSSPSSKPFNKIYLFNRLYGVYSIINHIELLADAVTAMLKEQPISQLLHENDAIYGGLLLSKTIYPVDSIVSYISTRLLYNSASTEWMYLFKKSEANLQNKRAIAHSYGRSFPTDGKNISDAVVGEVNRIFSLNDTTLYSSLMQRKYDNPADDNAPLESLPEDYLSNLLIAIDGIVTNDYSLELAKLFPKTEDDDSEKDPSDNCKNPFKKAGLIKKEIGETATLAAELFRGYFDSMSDGLEDNFNLLKSQLLDFSSDVSIQKNIIYNEDKANNPVYSLVCLCQIYNSLSLILDQMREKVPYIQPIKKEETKKRQLEDGEDTLPKPLPKKKESPIDPIPKWHFNVKDPKRSSCKYAKQGNSRLIMALNGDLKHIEGNQANKTLIKSDIKHSYQSIRTFFAAECIESCLNVFDKLITNYYLAFEAISKELDELSKQCDFELERKSHQSRFTYYAGSSAKEKQRIYNTLITELTACMNELSLTNQIDHTVGKLFESSCFEDFDVKKVFTAQNLVKTLCPVINKELEKNPYYKSEINKNIFEIMATQDPALSNISQEDIFRKALLANGFAIKYTLPDCDNSYKTLRALSHRAVAVLPMESKHYIENNPHLFNGKSPQRVLDELFAMAGESYGSCRFYSGLPQNEMYVLREVMGLKLSFIEGANKDSDNPIYYNDYKKALEFAERYFTPLWNPHVICSLINQSN